MKKKLFFVASLCAVLIFSFALQTSNAKAMSINELKAKIQELQQQIVLLQQQLAQAGEEPIVWCHNFDRNLKYGDSGEEVTALQTALEKDGFSISQDEKDKNFFGEKTASIVSGFQQKYNSEILSPLGLKYGTGVAASATRAKLNKIFRCNQACVQVITYAQNPTGTQCKQFLTPCDVPTGWIRVDSCPASSVPNYTVTPTSTLIRGQTYTFTGKIIGGLPNSPILFYLQRPDGTMEYNGYNQDPNPAITRQGAAMYTDVNGNFTTSIRPKLTNEGQNSTWISWVTVGGVASNKQYHVIVGAATTSCTDSDGGKNYYIKGTCKDLFDAIGEDECISGQLSEKYCTEKPDCFAVMYSCPNGCKNGACVQSITTNKIFIEAEDYSNRTSSENGSWWEVDGISNKFIEGPKAGELAPTNKSGASGNYMEVLGKFVGYASPISENYNGSFLDYKVSVEKAGDYRLYTHWTGRNGETDSVYALILKPDGTLLQGSTGYSNFDFFLYHGRTNWIWDNVGIKDWTDSAYAGRNASAFWIISEPGIYTIRLALREEETAVDALIFQTKDLPAPGNYICPLYSLPLCREGEKIESGRIDQSGCQLPGKCVSVAPSITVLSPNGGETWTFGTRQKILWKSSGITNNLTIYLRFQDGGVCKLADNVPPVSVTENPTVNMGGYEITIQENQACFNIPTNITAGQYYKIDIRSTDSPAITSSGNDSSDNYFSIVASTTQPSITVLSPKGGEIFYSNQPIPITWNSVGSSSKVSLEITKDGSSFIMINSSADNTGSYNYPTIPGSMVGGNNFKIKVTDVNNRAISDSSDNYFGVVSAGLGTENIENQLASIANVIFQIADRLKELLNNR